MYTYRLNCNHENQKEQERKTAVEQMLSSSGHLRIIKISRYFSQEQQQHYHDASYIVVYIIPLTLDWHQPERN